MPCDPQIIEPDDIINPEGKGKITEEPYDPTKDREKTRGYIAFTLIYFLGFIIFASFLFAICLGSDKRQFANLKELLDITLSPIIGLVGAATGFYFGEKHKS